MSRRDIQMILKDEINMSEQSSVLCWNNEDATLDVTQY